ncbi:MAG TPA: hypothetical protein PJ982_03805, partial [Lacipirellulaceae bacterium]|nr:hypothetical protein [Lacipirellulaceae bacterium]
MPGKSVAAWTLTTKPSPPTRCGRLPFFARRLAGSRRKAAAVARLLRLITDARRPPGPVLMGRLC